MAKKKPRLKKVKSPWNAFLDKAIKIKGPGNATTHDLARALLSSVERKFDKYDGEAIEIPEEDMGDDGLPMILSFKFP